MARYLSDDDFSDSENEVFFAPLTLPQIKRQLLSQNRRSICCTTIASKEDCNESLKIIETHSAPDILKDECTFQRNTVSKLSLSPEIYSSWDIKPNDTFLEMEKMVSDLSINTKDIIAKITKEPQNDQETLQNVPPLRIEIQNDNEIVQCVENLEENIKSPCRQTDGANSLAPTDAADKEIFTPTKQVIIPAIFSTPSERIHSPTFKTPGNSVSHRKLRTPSTKNLYQHVISPVATYINRCPFVPLVRDVRPKKPMPCSSSIPKPVTNAPKPNLSVKENISLQPMAYKAAAETKMIDIPDEGTLPKSQWAKQLSSSIPRVTVIKHQHREGSIKKPLKDHQEESFAELSIHQADTSVCTKRCAFSKLKKHV